MFPIFTAKLLPAFLTTLAVGLISSFGALALTFSALTPYVFGVIGVGFIPHQ